MIIRADNLGDLVMSSPAIRALKQTFGCRITLLTSAVAAQAAALIDAVDETIVAELPWVKKEHSVAPGELAALAETLRRQRFDGCVIFTVYSQSALPAALLAWMSGIPRRLAYCRENPYGLLNYWLPDKEPYTFIRHQVERDLDLVRSIGAIAAEERIVLNCLPAAADTMARKMSSLGLDPSAPFILFHPGVSEPKRAFPEERWVMLAREAAGRFGIPVCFTGSAQEKELAGRLQQQAGKGTHVLAGLFDIAEFAALIGRASLLVSVNTGAVHIAAGMQTPVIVLYARTNPQHTPWSVPNKVFEYSIPPDAHSRNEVIRYVSSSLYAHARPIPAIADIIQSMEYFLEKDIAGFRLP